MFDISVNIQGRLEKPPQVREWEEEKENKDYKFR